MNVCKILLNNGTTKILNLSNVSCVTLNKKLITLKYNFTETSGVMFFGSGIIDNSPYTENLHYNDEKEANADFEYICNSFYKK